MEEILKVEKIEIDNEERLRPATLSEYVGQEKAKTSIEVFIKSAKIRKSSLDHMLFYGPPGLGKTTLSQIVANEMQSKLITTTGPAIERPGDLAAILTSLNENDILFIDEIHRLNRMVEEILYPAMEDFVLDIIIDNGPNSKTIRLDIPKFTLIGATTKAGLLSPPLRDRFGSINRLELYSISELSQIIKRDARILNIAITEEAIYQTAIRSRGTPRIAIRILKRLRDFALVSESNEINIAVCNYAMPLLGIDQDGLDDTDKRIVKAIATVFHNGPVGLETLAAYTGEDTVTIEDICEPYLLQIGFLQKTQKGRILTEKGIVYAKENFEILT